MSVLAYTGLSGMLVMEPGLGGSERRQQLERHPVRVISGKEGVFFSVTAVG
jgi:hypothetical protein